MKDRRRSVRRRWPILLLEFSPLLAVAYLVAVFSVVPMSLAAQMVAYQLLESKLPEFGQVEPRVMAAEWMRMMEDPQSFYQASPESDPFYGLERAKGKAYEGMIKRADEMFAGKAADAVFASDDPAFKELASWESTAHAGVWAFLAKAPKQSRLIAKVESAPELLPSPEEMRSVGATDVAGWLWRQNSPPPPEGAKYAVFNTTQIQGGGSGGGDEKRFTYDTYIVKGKNIYRLTAITKADPYGNMQSPFDQLSPDVDPASPGFTEIMEYRAEKSKANIYVFGPMRVELTPLREPKGHAGSGKAVADAVWPGDGMQNGYGGSIKAAGDVGKAVAPYPWVMMSPGAMAADGGALPEVAMYIDGSGFLFVVGMNENPQGAMAEEILALNGDPWRRFKLEMAAQSVWLLGFGVAMLGASLVASPAAFIYDRKREAQARVLAEMQRVQQDAHDKVYNRLSALSKRAELTSATVSDSVAQSMGKLAEDIRTTVTDLQQILGDAERASAVAPVESSMLVEQIENACRAQEERLGVQIAVRASALPEVDPQVGWDVQCIVEEAVNNAAVRGGARAVEVMLRAGQDALVIEVEDDGVGLPERFDIDVLPETSTGLRGMRDRVERRGGSLRLERRDHGTLLRVRLPLG